MQQRTDSALDPSGPTPPVRTSSIQSIPVLDDSSSLTATSKPPQSASTVGTEVPPTALNTNTSSQKRNSLSAVPVRTSSTKNAAEQSPTSTSSTAVTATRDADVTSTTGRKRRRRREGSSTGSSVTGEEGRSRKQGGIGRFFGFLCCRAGASPGGEVGTGSRITDKRPSSIPSRSATPVGKILKQDISDSDSRDAAATTDNEKSVVDSGENKLKPLDGSSVPPVILNSESVLKDDDKINTAEGEGLVEKDGSASEETSANKVSLLDTTPIVTVQAPTPKPDNESDDNSSRPGSASFPEPATELVIKKMEDVDMKDAPADDASSDDGRANIALPLPHAEEARHGGDSDSDDGSEAGPGTLVEPPLVDDKQQWLLPPIAPRFEGKKCLVLDLDETLVHSSFKVLPQYILCTPPGANWRNRYFIRPISPFRWRSRATITMSMSSKDLGLTSS